MIDISSLHNGTKDSIDISGTYEIPKEYYEKTDVYSIENIEVIGNISKDEEDIDSINCTIKGSMKIQDSISLEEVDYPFLIEYDDIIPETSKKSKNILDIFQFLWENIVLEVPLQFTKVDDLSKFHGDGWKLISEDEYHHQNNPFSDLLKDFDKE